MEVENDDSSQKISEEVIEETVIEQSVEETAAEPQTENAVENTRGPAAEAVGEAVEETIEETVEETVHEETVEADDAMTEETVEETMEETVEETVHEEVVEDSNDVPEPMDDAPDQIVDGAYEEVVNEETVENADGDDSREPASQDQINLDNDATESSTSVPVNTAYDSDSDDDQGDEDNKLNKVPDSDSDSDNDEGPKETIASDDEEAPERQYGKTGLESSDEEDEGDNTKPAPTGLESDSDDEGPVDQAPVEQPASPVKAQDSSDDEGPVDSGPVVSDFDLMMQKKKEENRMKRMKGKKNEGQFISDVDDSINSMMNRMKEAADSDKESNINRRPGFRKMKMLKEVVKNITKSDINEVLIEHGIMSALADWISPLPDKSLPSLTIRSELLRVLRRNFLHVSAETLKLSGIGKAVMLLYKHPKELRENKQVCRELVAKWSRPIFGLNDNFSSVSREAREQRDFELLPKQKKKRLKDATESKEDKEQEEADNEEALKPGRKGFINRARVPAPSNQEYVVRPKWNVDGMSDSDDDDNPRPKKKRRNVPHKKSAAEERLERQLKRQLDHKRSKKTAKAATVNLQKISL